MLGASCAGWPARLAVLAVQQAPRRCGGVAARALCSKPDTAYHGTTILCVRRHGKVVMAGDGQVSLGPTIHKPNASKVRPIATNAVVGFAGTVADCLTLVDHLEKMLEKHPGQLARSCVELAKLWRTDRMLRRLKANILVADASSLLEVNGSGDVSQAELGLMAIGSGGHFALAAARGMVDVAPALSAEDVARRAMRIAGNMCVYTNHELTVYEIDEASGAVRCLAAPSPQSLTAG
eukprot:gnl/Hemi2/5127_TR1791_c0_g11_i1.p1 gnl/Hemi2/5127_TR1791_c0_g11~~gnl/Hemi2/5127_TR1791_c0_g11_i1.p1  ORF type:complete len:236 (-),score=69.84 gnl/Hemi2/5127_TR1791_c0_g11_i1:175-882(-)